MWINWPWGSNTDTPKGSVLHCIVHCNWDTDIHLHSKCSITTRKGGNQGYGVPQYTMFNNLYTVLWCNELWCLISLLTTFLYIIWQLDVTHWHMTRNIIISCRLMSTNCRHKPNCQRYVWQIVLCQHSSHHILESHSFQCHYLSNHSPAIVITPIHPPSNCHQYNMSLTNITMRVLTTTIAIWDLQSYSHHAISSRTTIIAIISVTLSKSHHNDIISAEEVIIQYDNIRPAIWQSSRYYEKSKSHHHNILVYIQFIMKISDKQSNHHHDNIRTAVQQSSQ